MADADFRWTQDEWGGEAVAPPSVWSSVQGWAVRHGWLFRSLILLAGFGLFELTANAALVTAVGCVEFGRTDFGTAWWLRKSDPDPIRRSLCQRCYLVWGLWRVTAVAFLFLAVVIGAIIVNELGFGPVEPPEHLVGALGLLALTTTSASGLALLVIATAYRRKIRIWIGPEPRWARQQGVWPPSIAHRLQPSTNQGKIVFYVGCFGLFFPTLVVAVFVCFLVPSTLGPWVFLGLTILMLIAVVVVVSHLERRVLARSPAEFWPPDGSASGIFL